MSQNVEESAEQCKKNKWFEVECSIEALGMTKDVVEASLRHHIDKLDHVKNVRVTETKFQETLEVDKPLKNIEKAFSQIVTVKFFAKNLHTLMHVVTLYGPSAIEILGPQSKDIEMGEIQDIANSLASLVHQFAAAGAGGIVMTPEKN